jgi:hypothetical protein
MMHFYDSYLWYDIILTIIIYRSPSNWGRTIAGIIIVPIDQPAVQSSRLFVAGIISCGPHSILYYFDSDSSIIVVAYIASFDLCCSLLLFRILGKLCISLACKGEKERRIVTLPFCEPFLVKDSASFF